MLPALDGPAVASAPVSSTVGAGEVVLASVVVVAADVDATGMD